MFQLQYNKQFTDIIEDIPTWKIKDDIPNNIKDFIISTSDSKVIYETGTGHLYCAKCVCQLDDNNYCKSCGRKHQVNNLKYGSNRDIIEVFKVSSNTKYQLNHTNHYYVFDIKDNLVYLYLIREEVSYDNPFYSNPFKTSNISIELDNSYLVEKDGLINLNDKTYKYYYELDSYITKHKDDESLFDLFPQPYNSYIYTDNLNDLKDTIYRYTKIWLLKDKLKEEYGIGILELTLNPLYYLSFEYLVNYYLYSLAIYNAYEFKSGNTFESIFSVEKKYLKFMSLIDITYQELKVLRICPCNDKTLLEFFKDWIDDIEILVDDYKINLITLKDMFDSQDLSSDYIMEYIDYIYMARDLHLDLREKKVLYPNDLLDKHDELYNQLQIIKDPLINEKISHIGNLLSINNYEDDKYIIIPAISIDDLIDESKQQHNCVRTYADRIANGECQIYFLREKKQINKSLVTIEVRNKRVEQARIKYNELPNDELKRIINKWEKELTVITVD